MAILGTPILFTVTNSTTLKQSKTIQSNLFKQRARTEIPYYGEGVLRRIMEVQVKSAHEPRGPSGQELILVSVP